MPRKMRNPKPRFEEISDETLHFLSDALLGIAPERPSLRMYILRGDSQALKKLWSANRGLILEAWIRARPGTRPQTWWKYDAPRISPESIALLGRGAEVVRLHWADFCETRKRLGGIGTPDYLKLNIWPSFDRGIPSGWVSQWEADYYNGRRIDIHGNKIGTEYHEGHFTGVAIDVNDPPHFESQASYLRRHALLEPSEERRLKAEDFEPEAVAVREEDESAETLATQSYQAH